MPRIRKTPEEVAMYGLAGYTKKQAEQHLHGEVIDRTPRSFVDFEWNCKKKGGERVKQFFKSFITHTSGRWKGKKFKLLDWQIDLIDKLFGTFKPNGLRRYKECLLEIAKKNGKTELAAGLGLYLLLADGEGSPEIALAAFDRHQATICFRAVAQMVRQKKALSNSLKILTAEKKVSYVTGNGLLQVVSSETASKHGLNLSGLIFDELHAQKTRDLFDIMTEGSGAARSQPLFLYLTTAGWDRNSVCYEVYQRALKVKENPEIDPIFLSIIYEVPGDANWEDEENWKLANPALNHIFDLENLREEYRKAKENPAKENVFRRLRLNQWTSQETRWISLPEWDRCGVPLLLDTLHQRPCYGGLDLSSTTDLTAFVIIYSSLNGDGTIDILPFFWMPEEDLKKKIERDHLPYDVWVQRGLIQGVPGKIIDYDIVRAKIMELKGQYPFTEIAYDPWNATQMALDLEKEGLVMVQFKPTFQFFSPPMKEFLTKITTGKIRHGGNPVLRAMLDNMRVITDANENVRPDKSHSNSRIDGIVASIMAYDRLMRHPEPERFIYDHNSISSLQPQIEDHAIKSESIKKQSGPECLRCGKTTEGMYACPHCGKLVEIEVRNAA
jgi:phage terminase large subunit-like protein